MTGERAVPLSFDAAAQQATQSRVPVPRGIAVRLAPPARRNAPPVPTAGTPSDEGDDAAIKAALPGWQIEAFAGLPDWFRAVPPAPVPLAECWKKVQDLRQLPSVTAAEPLLLTREREPASKMAENQFALAYDAEPLALWGSWHGRWVGSPSGTTATSRSRPRGTGGISNSSNCPPIGPPGGLPITGWNPVTGS